MISEAKKNKINPILLKVIVVSVLAHVVIGVVAGFVTIATHVMKEEAQFEEPPAVVEEKPPPDVKVEIKPQQVPKQPLQSLRMRPVANIAISNVSVELPSMSDDFTVSAGLGTGMGGNLLGGARGSIGMGVSDINVFGLKAKAERVLFLIDASRNMLTDKKGGLNSYQVIKDEITTMVGELSTGTLFNVAMYDSGSIYFFSPTLKPAGTPSHKALVSWIDPINSSARQLGLPRGKDTSVGGLLKVSANDELFPLFQRSRGTSGLTHLAMEQRVDAVFIISGDLTGFSRMNGVRKLTPAEQAKQEAYLSSAEYQNAKAAYNAEVARVGKLVAAAEKRENAARAKKGQPPKVWGVGGAARMEAKAKYYKIKFNVSRPQPGITGRYAVDSDQIKKYFRLLKDQLYPLGNQSGPCINVVLFLAGDEAFSDQKEDSLKAYVRFFNGKHRVIRGLNEIKAAASAGDSEPH